MKLLKRALSAAVLLVMGLASVAAAQDTTTTTPGAPNTGAGGDTLANTLVLGASAVVALTGAAYLSRKKLTR